MDFRNIFKKPKRWGSGFMTQVSFREWRYPRPLPSSHLPFFMVLSRCKYRSDFSQKKAAGARGEAWAGLCSTGHSHLGLLDLSKTQSPFHFRKMLFFIPKLSLGKISNGGH